MNDFLFQDLSDLNRSISWACVYEFRAVRYCQSGDSHCLEKQNKFLSQYEMISLYSYVNLHNCWWLWAHLDNATLLESYQMPLILNIGRLVWIWWAVKSSFELIAGLHEYWECWYALFSQRRRYKYYYLWNLSRCTENQVWCPHLRSHLRQSKIGVQGKNLMFTFVHPAKNVDDWKIVIIDKLEVAIHRSNRKIFLIRKNSDGSNSSCSNRVIWCRNDLKCNWIYLLCVNSLVW